MCFMHRSSRRKNVFAKQKIKAGKIDCINVWNVRCILNFVGTSESSAITISIALTLSGRPFQSFARPEMGGGGLRGPDAKNQNSH